MSGQGAGKCSIAPVLLKKARAARASANARRRSLALLPSLSLPL